MASLRLANWELTQSQRFGRHREDIDKLTETLTPEARQYFYDKVAPTVTGRPSAVRRAYEKDYATRPVKVEQFINDPYFLGSVLRNDIFPKVRDGLIELFDGEYFEVLLAGSTGWGKSMMSSIGILYDIYLVSCLKSPADMYGLVPGSNVAFINVSVNKTQATKILFGSILNLVKNCPYFREKFPWDKNVNTELRFPRSVFAYPVAASEQALLGEGVFSAAFDEMNFYAVVDKSRKNPEGQTYDQALILYNRMSRRIRSRMNQRGRLPGHLWMVSSARYPNDFTERKAREALEDPGIFVREYSAWETRPASFYMTTTFKVEVGDINRRTRVLTGEEKDVNLDRVIEVPDDYREDFEKDPDGAVRDQGGYSILTVRPFITRRDLITEMFAAGAKMGLKHPFTDYSVTLQGDGNKLIPENLHWVTVEPIEMVEVSPGKFEPKRELVQGPYYCHIDLGLTGDACGFCVGHVVGQKIVWRGFGEDRKSETKPIIRIDLSLQIVPPKYGEILFSTVRGLLYKLRDLGMQFGMVSYDSWNSADSIQTLKAEGFSADTLSMDRDPEAYEEARTAIYDGRIQIYPMPVLNLELSTIMMDEKNRKIDHPAHGTKDCSDAFAGVVHHAEHGFAGGATSQWQDVTTITVHDTVNPVLEDNEMLWQKIANGIPLSPEEIARLK